MGVDRFGWRALWSDGRGRVRSWASGRGRGRGRGRGDGALDLGLLELAEGVAGGAGGLGLGGRGDLLRRRANDDPAGGAMSVDDLIQHVRATADTHE